MAKKRRLGFIRIIIILALLAVMGYSGYNAWQILEINRNEYQIRREIWGYRPEKTGENNARPIQYNQSIIDLQNEVNPDIIGWLSIDNTRIDYPVVLAEDNDFYLRLNIHKEYAYAGSVFMDYRNGRELADFNSIIYGHNMKNGTMMGDLTKFHDPDFFYANDHGFLFLVERTYKLNFFASLLVLPDDEMIYGTIDPEPKKQEEYLAYLKKKARCWRDLGLFENKEESGSNQKNDSKKLQIITLSTCSYEFDDARMILIGTLE